MEQSTGRTSGEPQGEAVQAPAPTSVPSGAAEHDNRELLRVLRQPKAQGHMPESEIWRAYMELIRRGEPHVTELFLRSLKGLHRRRALGASELPCSDPCPDEHRLAENPYVGELWKAYKRCIAQRRPGPASVLLRDLEQQLVR